MNSDTPRADAVTFHPELMRLSKTVGVPVEVTPAETSRQLERELTVAKAEIERLTRERDEAYAKGFADAQERADYYVCDGVEAAFISERIRAMKPEERHD